MRPRIGIAGDTYLNSTTVSSINHASYATAPIINSVYRSNGLPFILPTEHPQDAADFIEDIDGLFLTGGFDVDPHFYGETPNRKLKTTYLKRDEFEISLVKSAIDKGIPIFGICRGSQIINVALGGSLFQDLDLYPKETMKHFQDSPSSLPSHMISTVDGTHLSKIIGTNEFVNSRHHQMVKSLGHGLVASAFAEDGVIEGIESDHTDQVLAVQWHPELMINYDKISHLLFDDLVKRAIKARN